MRKLHLVILLLGLGFMTACAAQNSFRATKADRAETSETEADSMAESRSRTDSKQSAAPGAVSIRISLHTGNQPLGAYSLLLTFDPDRAELKEVSGPDESEFQPPFHKVLDTGKTPLVRVRLVSYDIERAPTGEVPVARVSFSSSSPPSTFIRNLQVETVSDPEGNPIDATANWMRK